MKTAMGNTKVVLQFLGLGVVLSLLPMLSFSFAGEKEIVLGVVTKPGAAQNVCAEKFRELLAERSAYRVIIKDSGSLGTETEILRQIREGAIQIGVVTSGPFDAFLPEVRVIDYPFLFDNYDQVDGILDGPPGRELLKRLEKAGFQGLTFSENGFRHLTNNRRPVQKADDLAGLKIRVMESVLHQTIWRLFGAQPMPLGWPINRELAEGRVDGQENPLSLISEYALARVQKYLSLTGHVYSAHIGVANLRWFRSLPPEVQRLIQDSLAEAARFQRRWNRTHEAEFLVGLKAAGMIVDESPDKESFRRRLEALPRMDLYQDPGTRDLLALFIQSVQEARQPRSRGGTLRLAAFFNLTGGMSAIDLPGWNGAQLAVERINRRGGLLEGKRLEIVPYDTGTDQNRVEVEARKAILSGVLAGIGYGDSTYVLLAAPVFQAAGVPFVTSGATLPDLRRLVGDRLFMTAFGDDAQARAAAEYTLTRLKARRIALWTDTSYDFTRTLSRFFRDSFTGAGGQVLYEEDFPAGKKDFSALVKRLKEAIPAPEALFVSAVPDEAGIVVRQVREAGLTLPIISGDGFDTDQIAIQAGPQWANRVFFATHLFKGLEGEAFRDFSRAYAERFGRLPDSAFAALGYDAVQLIAAALEQAGATDPQALSQALRSTRGFQGITGEISYKDDTNPPAKPVAIIGLREGQPVLESVWRP